MGLWEDKTPDLMPAAVAKDSTLNLTRETSQETWWGRETDAASKLKPGHQQSQHVWSGQWAVAEARPPLWSIVSEDIITASHSKSGGKWWESTWKQTQLGDSPWQIPGWMERDGYPPYWEKSVPPFNLHCHSLFKGHAFGKGKFKYLETLLNSNITD